MSFRVLDARRSDTVRRQFGKFPGLWRSGGIEEGRRARVRARAVVPLRGGLSMDEGRGIFGVGIFPGTA